MNLYQFLKTIQEGIGDGCRVTISLWSFMGAIRGVDVDISWSNNLRYRFVLPDQSIESEGFLEHFSKYTIEKASREFRIAEVGED